MNEEAPQEEHRLVRERYAKAEALREAGGDPYPNRFDPTHRAADLAARADEFIESQARVCVAGRGMTMRVFGKGALIFFHLRDGGGSVQVMLTKDVLAEADLAAFSQYMDAGDWFGVEGVMGRTKTGEATVRASRIVLLAKTSRAMPEKHHGLKDQELRYRQRYVDLISNPEVRDVFVKRSRLIAALRRELDGRGYLEVETPMMQRIYGGAYARPFVTHHNALDLDLYLRIAPELYLKRLLVGGFERVYEINRNFRNEGLSIRHNPEFTMLELYTAYWDYNDTQRLTRELFQFAAQEVLGTQQIEYQGRALDLSGEWRSRPMLDLLREKMGLPPGSAIAWGMDANAVVAALPADVRGKFEATEKTKKAATGDEILMLLYEDLVEPEIWEPTFVRDYPKSLCPLAKSMASDPATAERFELFMGGMEAANAYSELNDPQEQLKHFRDQAARRDAGDEEAFGVDSDYVRALEYGMPPASGLGIGIDRMAMLLTNSASIRDVILFPLMRPEA